MLRRMQRLDREAKKLRKYLYFDQLLFLLPHLEDRDTYSNLNNERNVR
jgi:hypothetical protein